MCEYERISVAPRAEPTDHKATVDAHAPRFVSDAASERFNANDVIPPTE